ncbi:MAG: MFS transporter [Alphaproteobacteria bacterium]
MPDRYLAYILTFAVISTIIAVDIYIPCLPMMMDYFGASPELVQSTVSASIIGSSIFTIFVGPLSDAFGRRNLIVWSQGLYALVSLACAFAPSAEALIVLRFFQGIASTAPFVLAFAVIADRFKGQDVASYYALITMAITGSLMCAPVLGGYIGETFSWQGCFIFMGIFAAMPFLVLWKLLPETLKKPIPYSISGTFKTYREIFSNLSFMGMAIVPSVMIGGFVATMACASFYYIVELGLSASAFSLHQAFIMGCNTVFSYLSSRALKKYDMSSIVTVGLGIFTFGGISFLLTTVMDPGSATLLSVTMAFYASGVGFVFAAITAEAMSQYPDKSGVASSAIASIRGLLIASAVSLSSFIYAGDMFDVSLMLAAIAALCVMIMAPILRARSRRRLG